MSRLMPTIDELPVADIKVPHDRLRLVTEVKVQALVEVIGMYGFTVPISVRRTGGANILIDGAHRLEAMKRLGEASIPVRTYDCSATEARGMEITANLTAGMTPLQDAVFLSAWKRHYEQLHPETKRGAAGAMAKHGLQGNNSSFAELVASSRGVTPRQIRKVTAAVERLTSGEVASLERAQKPVPFDAIEQIGRIGNHEERSAVIRKLALGAAKKVAEARRQYAAEIGVEPPAKDPVEEAFKALSDAWDRAPMAAKKRFLFERASQVWDAQNRGVRLDRWREAEE